MTFFIRNISELDNKIPMIDSVWLKNELDIIRHCGISRQGFTDARTYAQVRKHVSVLTVNEAVRLAFIALYSPNKKPLIKKIINGPTLTKMDPLDLNNQINKWIQLDCPYGKELVLKIMDKSPINTVGELVDLAKKYQKTLDLKIVRLVLNRTKHRRVRRSTKITGRQLIRIMHHYKN